MKNCYQITHFSGRPTWKSAGGNAWHSCPESTPHECSVPNCPGDLNRRKLEMFDKMLDALQKWRTAARIYVERYHQTEDDIVDLDEIISKAKDLK